MSGQAPMWLAQFLLLAFFTAPIWIAVLVFIMRHKIRAAARRRRDQEIETQMRLGLADEIARKRAAERIMREYSDGS